jgi:hypothetical protein
MKKITILVLAFSISLAANACQTNPALTSEKLIENPMDTTNNMKNSIKILVQKGYSLEIITDLFGDENINFPKTEQELSLTIHIVDLIIENEQYQKTDKNKLVDLANEAYLLFTKQSLIANIQH